MTHRTLTGNITPVKSAIESNDNEDQELECNDIEDLELESNDNVDLELEPQSKAV